MPVVRELGTVRLPTAGNGVPLYVFLESSGLNARPPWTALSLVGEVEGRTVDLGVRHEPVDVAALPADPEQLVRSDLVTGLVDEYRRQLSGFAVSLARLGLADPGGVPAVLTLDDLQYLRHCLALVRRYWDEVLDDTAVAADRPGRESSPVSGYFSVEPTPAGYRAALSIFANEARRAEEFERRLAELADLVRTGAGDTTDR